MRITCLALFLLSWLTFYPGQLAAAETAASPAEAVRNDSEYTITVIPFYGADKIWALYTPFVDFMKESTGKPWTLKLFPNHDTLLDSLCGGKVAIALLGPVPLAKVMAKCQAQPVAVALGKDNSPFYRSILVGTDPAFTSLDDLRGKKIGLFKGSTAAHIMPRHLLKQAGIGKSDITSVFLEGQDQIIKALLSQQIAAAGLKENLFLKFKDNGLRVLTSSDPLPNFAFTASPQATASAKELLASTLLGLKPATNPTDKNRMSTWDEEIKNGFILPDNAFLSAVQNLLPITEEILREDR